MSQDRWARHPRTAGRGKLCLSPRLLEVAVEGAHDTPADNPLTGRGCPGRRPGGVDDPSRVLGLRRRLTRSTPGVGGGMAG